MTMKLSVKTNERLLLMLSKALSVTVSQLPNNARHKWSSCIWDRWSAEGNPNLRSWLVEQRQRTIEAVKELKGPVVVLEPGCGTGRITWDLLHLPNVQRVIAWDMSSLAISKAKLKLHRHPASEKLELYAGDVSDFKLHILNIAEKSKNITIVFVCLELLFHLPQLNVLFDEMRLYLPKGSVVVANLKTRGGLLFQSVKTRGLNSALRIYLLTILYLLTGFPDSIPCVCAHDLKAIQDLLNGFAEHRVVSDELYHWFVATV
jgi:SAM-dependent methyltransferase